ncbi:hypothetical protein [Psychroflexus maritimus]|uniref:PEP-CTERM protein-sorting domain-containing protein n=1 Tax=Psychroflexus maritimus TaxID=2714865 RepID=A0A967ACZ2_9FLAO|nr:hypothetical protein [Psychroflexus maritimus]NGZ89410.1 hypothetical protein [Psychroflexus maritimus]
MRPTYRYTLLLLLTLIITQVNAQGLEQAIGFDDQVNDVPINGLIALGMAVASYLGYKKFKK